MPNEDFLYRLLNLIDERKKRIIELNNKKAILEKNLEGLNAVYNTEKILKTYIIDKTEPSIKVEPDEPKQKSRKLCKAEGCCNSRYPNKKTATLCTKHYLQKQREYQKKHYEKKLKRPQKPVTVVPTPSDKEADSLIKQAKENETNRRIIRDDE